VRTFYLVVIALIFLLMQLVAAERMSIGPVAPDFLILITAFFGLYRGAIAGSIFGFFVGLLQDFFNPEFLGLNALTKTALGFVVGKAGAHTIPENVTFLFVLFAAVSWGHDILYLVFYHWPNGGVAVREIFVAALPSAIYTALLGVAVHKLLTLLGNKVVGALGKEGR
jgi:rod shape-determining protein MreD